MIKTLDCLNEDEHAIFNLVQTLKGTMEDVENQLESLDTAGKYRTIYQDYNSFFKSSNDLEALKRIIFIQWFAVSEPFAFTGISELNVKLERDNITFLIDLIAKRLIDEEFKKMIAHYYSISNWYFGADFKPSELAECIPEISGNSGLLFIDRGQMGRYWNAITLL